MTNDLEALERDLLARVTAANDEASLEALRVEALGKQGSISALMKNLGAMSPDERKTFGAALNVLKDKVTEAIVTKKAALAEAALDRQLQSEAVDVTLPPVRPRLGTIHPVSQVMEETGAHLRRDGLHASKKAPTSRPTSTTSPRSTSRRTTRRAKRRTRSSSTRRARTASAKCCARTRQPGASAHHAEAEAAHPHDLHGPHLPQGLGRHAHADVPPDRRPRHRRDHEHGRSEERADRRAQSVFRSRRRAPALPPAPFPVHRTERGSRCRLRSLRRHDQDRRGRRLARNSRLRHGAPERAARIAASIPRSTKATPSAWASIAWRCSNTACPTSATSSPPTRAG